MKRLLALLLALILVIGMIPAVSASYSTDPSNGMFAPDAVLTRGMFVYALWNYFGSPEPTFAGNSFTDVSESDYYHDAVYWAVESGIIPSVTNTLFDPGIYANRAQVATWLWRAAGSPETPTENPFDDVDNTTFFYHPALWAATVEGCMSPLNGTSFGPYEKCLYGHINWVFSIHTHEYTTALTEPTCTNRGYTSYTCPCGYRYLDHYTDALGHDYAEGVCTRCGEIDPNNRPHPSPYDPGNGMFAPDEVLTRGMFFYALWNHFGSPEPESTESPFTDVSESDYYFDAVCWAVENGITSGASPTEFGSGISVVRAQAAYWLWRAAGSPDSPGINPYTDVKEEDFFYEAALWSTTAELCMGPLDPTRFGPYEACLYGHINWLPTNHTHEYTADVTVPTCSEQGYTIYTCTICDYGYTAKYVDALGHDYTDGVCTLCREADPNYQEPVEPPFPDVPQDSFFYESVLWALENGITNGLTATEFGPDATCNRAQVVTFLWRAAGSPEPETAVHSFVDVQKGSFYEKPVLWAVEKGITNGADATHFNPGGVCNRAQVVTFLYRAFESPAVSTDGLPFTDVPAGAWYEAPIAWAVENGITNGLSATEFAPTASCNRAQVVTFLYRAYN